jgi:hypothetical protein
MIRSIAHWRFVITVRISVIRLDGDSNALALTGEGVAVFQITRDKAERSALSGKSFKISEHCRL